MAIALLLIMNKRLALILVLMSVCVAGITGLQLFWNYQNYKNTVRNFEHDINEALVTAAEGEIRERHLQIAWQFKIWLADTSFVTITCDNRNRHRETVFHMRDTHPLVEGAQPISLGINSFRKSLSEITPEARAYFIEHFGNNTLMGDLRKGIVYFYTQRLGDSLTVLYEKSHVNLETFRERYRAALAGKGIFTSFKLNSGDTTDSDFLTRKVNTALRAPYEREYVYATLADPDTYFLREMKWVILSTLLLIGITVFCFGYTARTLLSQYKLATLKDDFIHNMTHELNTPIASIRVTADALRTFDTSPEKQREYLDIIGQQTERLGSLTEQILKIDRLVSSHKDEKILAIKALIEHAIETLTVRIHTLQNSIRVNCRPDIHVRGDADALVNAFTNILDNAMKYSPRGSKIDIAVTPDKHYAIIAFADPGEGIPPEYREKVFEKFFRVPKGKTHNVKGYGLGLSYVQQVVHRHRGRVSIADNAPFGTVVSVKLPLHA